jgi:hypothetical protein
MALHLFSVSKADEQPGLWQWHWSLRGQLLGVFFVAESDALCQPSSADIFSRLKASTTDLMMLEHDETLEMRAFCMYNK